MWKQLPPKDSARSYRISISIHICKSNEIGAWSEGNNISFNVLKLFITSIKLGEITHTSTSETHTLPCLYVRLLLKCLFLVFALLTIRSLSSQHILYIRFPLVLGLVTGSGTSPVSLDIMVDLCPFHPYMYLNLL